MPIENPKTLDQLIDFFNENPAVFGWKSKCEELIIFAERLEQWLAERNKLIEQMKGALNVLVASATRRGPLWHGSAEMQIARAALSAAERGDG